MVVVVVVGRVRVRHWGYTVRDETRGGWWTCVPRSFGKRRDGIWCWFLRGAGVLRAQGRALGGQGTA